MKKAIVLFSFALVIAAHGQLLTLDGNDQAQDSRSMDEFAYTLRRARPNEIFSDRVQFSGVVVQVIKTRKPLQLINPAAPAEYGAADDNLARNIITRRPMGLKFFSVSF